MDETIDISDVVGSFFTVIGKPIEDLGRYKVGDQLGLFFRELNAVPYFLVLDNFEILLDPQTNKPMKPGFSGLIENAKENAGRSRVLFTSWECPASERGIRPSFYSIGGLDDSSAIQFLRRRGITEPDNELKKAVELSGGHPLALILLVQLVAGEEETLSGILSDDTLWQGEVAANIIDKVYKERLNEEERKLLQYVSLYRMPVPVRAIATAANDPDWTEAKVKETAMSMKRKSMLEKTGKNYWEQSLIDNYAYNKLVDRVERHKLACQYYRRLPVPEKRTKKEDVQSLIEAHYHACTAGDYDMAADIIFDNKLHEDLDRWGNYTTLVELFEKLLPESFDGKPRLTRVQTHDTILGSLGFAYHAQGQVKRAIKFYKQALVIAKEIGDRQKEGVWLGDLGIAYDSLGQVERAVEFYEQALVIAKEIGDRQNEGAWLGDLGVAYDSVGQVERAIDLYEQALVIAKDSGEQALVIHKKIDDRRGEGTDLGNLGHAYHDLGQEERAVEFYERALVIAKEIDDRRNEGTWLGSLGLAYSAQGQEERAVEFYEQALAIAKDIGDRRGEGNELNNLGVVFEDLKKDDSALACYLLARKIRIEIRDQKIETTENNIDRLRNKIGKTEFQKLLDAVEPKAEEIIQECQRKLLYS
jgi:tetratricopeptide (TPR) repeat protein